MSDYKPTKPVNPVPELRKHDERSRAEVEARLAAFVAAVRAFSGRRPARVTLYAEDYACLNRTEYFNRSGRRGVRVVKGPARH